MRYDRYVKAGYPISSGVAESACGHTVKNRMEGCGKRWSVEGAGSVLLLRSLYTSGDRDTYRYFHVDMERSSNHHNTLCASGIPDEYDESGGHEYNRLTSSRAAA